MITTRFFRKDMIRTRFFYEKVWGNYRCVSSTKCLYEMSAQNACMMLWLKTFCGVRWMVMSRSNQLKAGLWRMYYPKSGTLAVLRYSYPPKPSPVQWRDALNSLTAFQVRMIYYTKRYCSEHWPWTGVLFSRSMG